MNRFIEKIEISEDKKTLLIFLRRKKLIKKDPIEEDIDPDWILFLEVSADELYHLNFLLSTARIRAVDQEKERSAEVKKMIEEHRE
jgi:hypothetical protein